MRLFILTLTLVAPAALTHGAEQSLGRIERAKTLLSEAGPYPKGCSDFACAVLKISWEDANALMGDNPVSVGKDNKYSGLKPGDVVGWKVEGGHGHVAIYIGEMDQMFIDVNSENGHPRALKHGYGSQELFKSSRF